MPARTGLFVIKLAVLLAGGATVAVAASDRSGDASLAALAAASGPAAGSLGITAEPLDRGRWGWLGLPFGATGAVITSLADDGPAARAGVGIGDIAIAIDGRPVDRQSRIDALLGHRGPVQLAVMRDGVTRMVKIS